jgi:threonine/homoserine/homoserine lactone efflux protein
MESIFFLKGLVIGFAMAVPIGPAGILCIRKTLAEGRSRGIMIGLGAATADMLCGSVAAFGLCQRVGGLPAYMPVIGVFAGSCLWFLALSPIAKFFRKMLDSGGLRWVNITAGILILLSSVVAFASLI